MCGVDQLLLDQVFTVVIRISVGDKTLVVILVE